MLGKLFHTSNQRNRMLRNNILFSGVLKVIGLLTSLLVVPVTIGYLNSEVYGIWMTISSMLYWISTFDIGLGNGMRNYLTEAISKGDLETGRKYITTTFVYLSLIAALILLVLLVPMIFADYNKLFNSYTISNSGLREALMVAVVFTLFNFVLRNIGMVFVALQKYALNDLLNVSGNVIALGIIFVLTKTTSGNLTYVVLAYTATFTAIFALAAIPLFRKYPALRPRLSSFDRSLGRNIVSLGLGFFVIQITSCLVIFGAANFFITQFCGPVSVTTYNIAYKFFNLLVIAYTIFLSPMWNAYTDASVKGDWAWIKSNFRRSLKVWGLTLLLGLLMLAVCPFFFRLWVGGQVSVPMTVSLCTLLYVSFFNLNNCVTYLINGLNTIRVQIITSVVFTALYIVITLLFTGRLGIEGIVLTMAGSYAAMSLIHLYQCHLLINRKAQGIWNK